MNEQHVHHLNRDAFDDLYLACKEFVRKVESGEARSQRSYLQMKQAIAKAEGREK